MNSKISTINAKDGGLEFILSNGESLGVFKDELCIDENPGGFEAFRVSHPRLAMEGSGLTSIFMPHLSA